MISGAGSVTDGEVAGSDHLAISRRRTPRSREVRPPLTPLLPLEVEATGCRVSETSPEGLGEAEAFEGGGGVLLPEVEGDGGGGVLRPEVEGLAGRGGVPLPDEEGLGDFEGDAPLEGGSKGSCDPKSIQGPLLPEFAGLGLA